MKTIPVFLAEDHMKGGGPMMPQQLRRTAGQAMMGDLVGSIVHELNNRLTVVGLRIESLLAQTPEGDPRKGALKTIENDMDRMGDLVKNVLQLSGNDRGRVCIVAVAEEVKKVLELVQFHLLSRGVSIRWESAPELPSIRANRQQIRQLFFRLFICAMNRTQRGGTVTIRSHVERSRLEGGQECLVIEISGGGDGTPAPRTGTVVPFLAASLGEEWAAAIACCRRTVQGHRGTLRVAHRSLPPDGTLFHIALPVSG